MAWEVEYTDEFEAWWVGLNWKEHIVVDAVINLAERKDARVGMKIPIHS